MQAEQMMDMEVGMTDNDSRFYPSTLTQIDACDWIEARTGCFMKTPLRTTALFLPDFPPNQLSIAVPWFRMTRIDAGRYLDLP